MALGHAASCASKMCPPPRRVLTRHAETSTRNLQDGARFITAAASRRPIEFLGEVESVHKKAKRFKKIYTAGVP